MAPLQQTVSTCLLMISALSPNSLVAQTDQTIEYRVLFDRTFDSSGAIGELAIDASTRALYGVGTKIVDIDHGVVAGSISAELGHGYAFADDIGRGITRRAAVFDLRTKALIKPGREHSAAAVAYDHFTHRAALNFDSLSVLDVQTTKSVGAVSLGASKYVVADQQGRFLVGLASDSVAMVDAAQLTVTRRWGLGACRGVTSMTVDMAQRRLLVSCENNRLVVVDYVTGAIVATVAVAKADQLALDVSTRLLFAPSNHDTVAIVQQRGRHGYEVVSRIAIGPVVSAVAIDPKTHIVYLMHFGDRVNDETYGINLVALARSGMAYRNKPPSPSGQR